MELRSRSAQIEYRYRCAAAGSAHSLIAVNPEGGEMATREIDVTKAEEFAGRMLGVLNSGMLTLLISIGHQVRLFDTMAAGGAGTSAEIATAAGLDERYVREWLAGLTVGGIVEHDPEAGTYVCRLSTRPA